MYCRLWFLVFTTGGALTLLLGLSLLYVYYRSIGTLRDPLMLLSAVFLANGLLLTGALSWSTLHLALTNVSMSELRDQLRTRRSARLGAPSPRPASPPTPLPSGNGYGYSSTFTTTSVEAEVEADEECATPAEMASVTASGLQFARSRVTQQRGQFDRGLRANVAEFMRRTDATSLVRTRDEIQRMFARYNHFPAINQTMFSSDSLLSSLLYDQS